jgi:hypothetical protein
VPFEKNAIHRPSGENAALYADSVPATGTAERLSVERR